MVWVICLDLSGYMNVLSNARYRAARAAKNDIVKEKISLQDRSHYIMDI